MKCIGLSVLAAAFPLSMFLGAQTSRTTADPKVSKPEAVLRAETTVATQREAAPTADSVSPITTSGLHQVYTFQFSDPDGWQDITVANVLINRALDGRSACYLAYDRAPNRLLIVPDNGDASLASGKVMDGTGTVANGQCSIDLRSSTATGSGNTLTLALDITFSSGFGNAEVPNEPNNRLVYVANRDTTGGNTGWLALGVHRNAGPPSAFPRPVAMTPDAGSGNDVAITYVWQDATSTSNLQTTWALINDALDGRAACYIAYYRPGNQVFMIPDNGDGTQATNIVLTGTNTISNSQCTVSAQGSSVTQTGNQLSLTLRYTFKAGFTGPRVIWMAASSLAGQHSTWWAFGNWNVPAGAGNVEDFRALPEALPTSGPVPLTVTFRTRGIYTGGSIVRYRWDFEGDGIFDTSEIGARDFTRTFTTPGVRNAKLDIQNDKLETTSATVVINVGGLPPTATASVNPSNGPIPLAVTFTGTGSPGSTPISKYEWDFQGDGTFDFTSTTTGSASFTYLAAGTYNAVFRVTDSSGLSTTASATATAVRPGPPGSPTATITAPSTPQTRNAPASVSFRGSGSDPGGSIVKYEWDFNGDGTYDFSSATSATTSFTFNSPGTFTVAFRVTDNEGKTGIDTIDITINIAATLSLSTDTLRPPATVDVRTTLGGAAPVTIYLKNKTGQTVRTLVNNVSRNAGSYTDPWDGKDDSGNQLPEGAYYAILQYSANGVPRVLDLTNTTGNTFFNPSWTLRTTGTGTTCSACRFAPYDDTFLEGTFVLNRAAEVTLSIRSFFSTFLEKALVFDRKPYGRGTYVAVWDGTDNLGRVAHPAPPDTQFIFGMTAFTFPTNGIFLEVSPQLSNVTVSPNYFDPYTGDFQSIPKQPSKVQFTLNKTGNVTLQVIPVGSTSPIRTITQVNLSAGVNQIDWDGKADNGVYVKDGDYRLAIRASDAAGSQSLVRYLLTRVYY